MVVRRLIPAAIRRRYAVKFGIALLILGLSVGAIGLVGTAAITDEVEDRFLDDQSEIADQQAEQLQQWHSENQNTAQIIARSVDVDEDDPDVGDVERQLMTWDGMTDAHAITYVNPDGESVLASTQLDQGEPVNESVGVPEDGYDDLEGDFDSWTSEPILTDDNRVVVSYVHSVPGNDGALVYTVEYDLGQLADDGGTVTMVLDAENRVMLDGSHLGTGKEMFGAEYRETDNINRSATQTQRVSGSPDGALANETYGFDADDYVVSSSPVSGTEWVVLIHEPTEEAYGILQSIDDYGTYATLGGVLLIGLIGAVIGRNTAVSIDRLTERVGRMEEGDLDVDLETKRIDNIGRLYEGFDSMRNALREQIEEAEAARQEAERERERVQQINERLERTADEYSDVMEAAADGDLTARMDADTENEAMAEIGRDFNEMLAEIERTVAELDRFAAEVATASEEVTASSEEVRSASEQVTESVQEISEGASRQNDSLQSVNQEMNGLSTTTEQIAASSNQVADVAERTARTGQAGQEAAENAVDAMADIEAESDVAVEEIRQLEEEVEQIDELIATISDIAQQTNMLALNANIEASRSAGSGGNGEGFSVVAKQVKELSQDVEEAADAAEKRLESIRQQTLESAAEVEQTSAQVERATGEVKEAVEALEEIAEYARETNDGVQEISAATEQQAATTQEVVAMVDDAATISEETTAEAQNVAAAAEEQTTALTEVSESASDLATKAADLSGALDRFELDAEEVDAEVTDSGAVDATADESEAQPASISSTAGSGGDDSAVADAEDESAVADAAEDEPIAVDPSAGTAGATEPDTESAAEDGDARAEETYADPFEDLDSDDDPLALGGPETPSGAEPAAGETADAASDESEDASGTDAEDADGADDDSDDDEVFSFGDLDENP